MSGIGTPSGRPTGFCRSLQLHEQDRQSLATRWQRKDGSRFDVEINARLVTLAGQHLVYCVCRDITKRVTAEKAFRQSQQNLLLSQRITGIANYEFEPATGRWSGSEVLDELFGIGPDYPHDVDGWLGLIVSEDREPMACYLRDQVLAARQSFNREYRIRRASDGAVRWLHGVGRLEFADDGTPVRMLGTIQDITERKRTEEQLLKLSLAVEQSPESIVITDLDARIEYVNEAFLRVTGYTPRGGDRPESAHPAVRTDAERNLCPGHVGRPASAAVLERRVRQQAQGRQRVHRIGHASRRFASPTDASPTTSQSRRTSPRRSALGEELDRHRHHLEELV